MKVCIILFVGICAAAHSLSTAKDAGWWKTSVFYLIYPRSFKDSNNDGIGDLKGITSKLQYIHDTGSTVLWLASIYKSPQVDSGYDISDFRDIHEEYGTMEDFEKMVAETHTLGVRIIMDLVPNHSSDKHEWFIKSANRDPEYEDYYIWKNGLRNNTKPPNNWRSVYNGPAWTFNQNRQQWYLHHFASAQPDLNYRNPKVVQEMKDIMTFWMEKGVSGFRIDAVPFLFEKQAFPDEPGLHDSSFPEEYGYLRHIHTQNLPETYDMVYQWRQHVDDFSDDREIIIVTECHTPFPDIMNYYGNETTEGAHFTFNYLFITDLDKSSSAIDIVMNVQKWFTYMPIGKTANWILGNHDQHRVATRYGKNLADGLNLLHLLLPGVKVVYTGEEIAMENGEVTFEEGQDIQACNTGSNRYNEFTRDPERTPFHWDSSVNAGFNEGAKTWLPVSKKYKENNLELQHNSNSSHFRIYQDGVAIRMLKTFIEGDIVIKAYNPRVIILKRELSNHPTIVFAFNIGPKTENVDLSILTRLPDKLQVEIGSGSVNRVGSLEKTDNVTLNPFEAIVFLTEDIVP